MMGENDGYFPVSITFTDRASMVLDYAKQEAENLNHMTVRTEHILLGLVREGSGVAANVLYNLEIDLEALLFSTERHLCHAEPTQCPQPAFSAHAQNTLKYAAEEAENLGHTHLGTEHILLGLLREEDGLAWRVLKSFHLKLEDLRQGIKDFWESKKDIPTKVMTLAADRHSVTIELNQTQLNKLCDLATKAGCTPPEFLIRLLEGT